MTYKNGDIRVVLPHPDVEYDDPSTLDRLTWENLGYRLGRILGSASAPFIDAMYSMCCLLQHEQENANTTARSA